MTLHENEVSIDEATVRSLLEAQRPEWAGLSLSSAGAGTDNTMYRLGDDLLVRLPEPLTGGSTAGSRGTKPSVTPSRTGPPSEPTWRRSCGNSTSST
ncbi:hypothetical protein GCM10022226_61290 [Sphaerisporangium flaviroseum]|uniref:Aminoglycoside phosphotransferase domain-containing protein n=1 Tax=Sphaerisporangium flaviroseum TaxID=509199 RepID=A0ABP7J1D7_9ACTN